jgi:hypothetical protein
MWQEIFQAAGVKLIQNAIEAEAAQEAKANS